jgi:transcriptional regulator with XRE-family HTH domain
MQTAVRRTNHFQHHAGRVAHSDGRIRAEEVAVRFGQNLVRARRRAGLSQEELGNRSSLHRTEIGLLEHGKRIARVDTLIKLAGAMAIQPSELLEGIYWAPGDTRRGGFSFSESRGSARKRPRR